MDLGDFVKLREWFSCCRDNPRRLLFLINPTFPALLLPALYILPLLFPPQPLPRTNTWNQKSVSPASLSHHSCTRYTSWCSQQHNVCVCLCVCMCDGDLIAGNWGWPFPVFIFLSLAVHGGERQFLSWSLEHSVGLFMWLETRWRGANTKPFLLGLENPFNEANKILGTLAS